MTHREEATMKLLDRTIELSAPVQELAASVKALAQSVQKVAQGLEKVTQDLVVLANNQAAHHRMIMHMHLVQQVIMKRMSEGGMDTSLPEIDASKDKAAAKKSN